MVFLIGLLTAVMVLTCLVLILLVLLQIATPLHHQRAVAVALLRQLSGNACSTLQIQGSSCSARTPCSDLAEQAAAPRTGGCDLNQSPQRLCPEE